MKLKGLAVCSQPCGQRRFFGQFPKGRKPANDRASRGSGVSALRGRTNAAALPNQARYQLRYTRIFNFCHDTTAKGKIKRFFCLWSFLWSNPLLCRFRQPGRIPQTQVSQGFAAFRLTLSRIPPRHSQTTRAYHLSYTRGDHSRNIIQAPTRKCKQFPRLLDKNRGMD